jgi:hypothetical protein
VLDDSKFQVFFEGDTLVRYDGDVEVEYGSKETVRENSEDEEPAATDEPT